jgi:hypothetical protein
MSMVCFARKCATNALSRPRNLLHEQESPASTPGPGADCCTCDQPSKVPMLGQDSWKFT